MSLTSASSAIDGSEHNSFGSVASLALSLCSDARYPSGGCMRFEVEEREDGSGRSGTRAGEEDGNSVANSAISASTSR